MIDGIVDQLFGIIPILPYCINDMEITVTQVSKHGELAVGPFCQFDRRRRCPNLMMFSVKAWKRLGHTRNSRVPIPAFLPFPKPESVFVDVWAAVYAVCRTPFTMSLRKSKL